jgi:hypothetical protein
MAYSAKMANQSMAVRVYVATRRGRGRGVGGCVWELSPSLSGLGIVDIVDGIAPGTDPMVFFVTLSVSPSSLSSTFFFFFQLSELPLFDRLQSLSPPSIEPGHAVTDTVSPKVSPSTLCSNLNRMFVSS